VHSQVRAGGGSTDRQLFNTLQQPVRRADRGRQQITPILSTCVVLAQSLQQFTPTETARCQLIS